MSDAWGAIYGPDGEYVGAIDSETLRRRAHQVAARLALASHDPDEVMRIVTEATGGGATGAEPMPPMISAMFQALILQEFTVDLFGPLLRFVKSVDPAHDFDAELRAHAGDPLTFDLESELGKLHEFLNNPVDSDDLTPGADGTEEGSHV